MEPERPIEKLLRACAKKRRDEAGAPFELHQVDRRLLQGEVARRLTRPEAQPGSFSGLFGRLWPGLALTTLTLLAVAAVLLVPSLSRQKPETLMARHEEIPIAAPANEPLSQHLFPPAEAGKPKDQPVIAFDSDRAAQGRRDDATLNLNAGQAPAGKSPSLTLADTTPQATTTATAPALNADLKKSADETKAAPATEAPASTSAESAFAARNYRLAIGGAVPATPPAPLSAAPSASDTGLAVAANRPVASDGLSKQLSEAAAQTGPAYKTLAAGALAGQPGQVPITNSNVFGYFADLATQTKGLRVQRFAQLQPATKAKNSLLDKVSPNSAVLVSFQLEQSGQTVRIVDSDGSVYTGFVQLPGSDTRQRSAGRESPGVTGVAVAPARKLEPSAVAAAGEEAAPDYFTFSVAGTNRTSNQKVVFTGSLLPAINSTVPTRTTNSSGGGMGGGGGQTLMAPGSPPLPALMNGRISGKVLVGQQREIEINALPEK